MPSYRGAHVNSRGYLLEDKVAELLEHLGSRGLARDIKKNAYVKDRDGNMRKLDISFVLITDLVEINVTIECKSKDNPLSIDHTDQIKTFARDIPGRNIFWLITEAGLNAHATTAVQLAGISHYTLTELRSLIETIIKRYDSLGIEGLRTASTMFGRMHAALMSMTDECLAAMAFELYDGQPEIVAVLWDCVNKENREEFRDWLARGEHLKFRDDVPRLLRWAMS
jgi:hypothetical protein